VSACVPCALRRRPGALTITIVGRAPGLVHYIERPAYAIIWLYGFTPPAASLLRTKEGIRDGCKGVSPYNPVGLKYARGSGCRGVSRYARNSGAGGMAFVGVRRPLNISVANTGV